MVDESTTRKLRGVIPALVAPMKKDGTVDYTLLEKQANYLCQGGISGIFVNGTTGAGAYLNTQEKFRILKKVQEIIPKGVSLCAACIQPSTAQVLEEMRVFKRLRPDFVVAVTPFYMETSQDMILHHFREIARAAPAPLIIYNIPQNTHNPITLKTIIKLAGEKNIAGIKDSSRNMVTFSRGILSTLPGPFAWIQGDDYLESVSYLIGAKGVVTGLGNIWIDPYIELYRSFRKNDITGIREGQRKINALLEILEISGYNVIPSIKAATELLGRGSRWMRIPAMVLSDDEIDQIALVLSKLKLL